MSQLAATFLRFALFLIVTSVVLGEDLIRIDPEAPLPPLSESSNGKDAWRKMVEHVPEFPEKAIVGTWNSISKEESLPYIYQVSLQLAEAAAALQGRDVTEQEKLTFQELAQLNSKTTTVYRGTITFDENGKANGSVTSLASGKTSQLSDEDWRFEAPNKVHLHIYGPSIGSFRFAGGGRLVSFENQVMFVLEKE